MNNDEKQFENQIGNLGGDALPQDDSMIGKKLRHVPGKKDELDDDENADMEEFINRSRSKSKIVKLPIDDAREEPQAPRLAEGWFEINRNEMGIRSRFYADDWRFFIRPATVEAIKNWSAIDEERVDVMIEGFNDIVRSCLSIKSSTGNIPWNRINSWDRFWFILKIRQISFKQGESKIEFTDTCPECEEEITYRLEPENLFYEFPDDDIVEKHWNSYERAWYIDPKEYGLDRPAVKLYVPTIEKDQAILDWGIAKARQKKKIDKKFLDFLPWMLPKAPKDENTLEHLINEAHMTYKNWDVDMFEFMDDVIRNITINPSENLKQICPHCGEEVVSNVRFPKGIRALFKTEAKHTKFGSR
jgi:predicted RNA-binding Zn-ribbon protein involved in translation (DUF1610 family)